MKAKWYRVDDTVKCFFCDRPVSIWGAFPFVLLDSRDKVHIMELSHLGCLLSATLDIILDDTGSEKTENNVPVFEMRRAEQ